MAVAERLQQHTEEILRQWETSVRAAIPLVREKNSADLSNCMSHFMAELTQAASASIAAVELKAPREHAEQRVNWPGYPLENVVQEYSLLRRAILDVLNQYAPLELAAVQMVLDTIDDGIRASSEHFVEVQDRALRESEERFRLLVDTVKDYGIFMLDPEGYVVSWNRGAEYIKGYSAEEIVGKHFSLFYTEKERARGKPGRSLATAAREGRFEDLGYRMRKDGSTFFADVVITAMRDDTGRLRGFAKVTRDISERHMMQNELRKHAEALAEANRRKDEFLAMLAHELRNPLASIVTSAEVLRLRSSDNPDARDAQDIIERQGRHLAHLVDDLLDVARITQGKIELRKTSILLQKLAEQVAETLRPFFEERQHNFALELPEEAVWLRADFMRLSQVLANLLHNSAKFTHPGGTLALRAWIDDGEVVIQVSDTGAGIDPQLLPRVFDIFTQGAHSHNGVSGLGIGLTLVRQLVEMHNGRVSAHSEGRGKGSEFTVRLPVTRVGEAPKKAPRAGAQKELHQPRKDVLVVDDNVDAAVSVAMLLELCGHSVRVTHNGKDALKAAEADPPQVIFLDIGLPDVDGYEVARQLRSQPAFERVTIVALTGYGQEADRRRAEEAGFDHHLTKPANLAGLQSVMETGARSSTVS